MLEFNRFCRANNVKFVCADSWGVAGYVFCDFGEEFIVRDKDGEEVKQSIVVSVTQGNPGVVTVHEDKRHGFTDGDFIKFQEVEGMTA
eukprot:CAMPEP_0201281344 /NCGR_PEP_ID=MMETSP1317-20130820/2466_1 /ASSEMBLY_ACC=CAM_ASM_000770 /TAXON_ID=187299 /ORGANISM="Undescribed Undescribed, Strain Undescribed" /LENGTH=87 /DNA_ID=CAMNT_0047590953 /DNA_START=418 /DNA_END=677 /DNA_ORIENTATION=+